MEKRSIVWGGRGAREAVGRAKLLSVLLLSSLTPIFVLMLFLRIGNVGRGCVLE